MQSLSENQNPAIGIDLGTTYCCVAIFHGRQEESIIIPNDLAKNTTPSYVAYEDDGEIIVGEAAKNRAHENPENTIFDVKRLIGRSYHDPKVHRYKHLWPFQVVNHEGQVGVLVQNTATILPENISKELITYLRQCAEEYLHLPVNSAVVTVPAHFSHLQMQLTREACVSAGLERVHLISEPTAASLAYGLQKIRQSHTNNEGRTCLIFDLGGGTFDVAVLRIVPGNSVRVQIKAIGGDTRLGGGDFDEILLQYCIDQFKKTHGIDLAEGKDSLQDAKLRYKIARRLRRIRNECEKQKCFLSQTKSVTISLDAIHGEIDLVIPVTRELFEDLIKNNLVRCMDILDGILEESGLGRKSIEDVVMIGGSSRIPKVQSLVSEYFGGKTLFKSINADEAVACGAAIHAYHLFNAKAKTVNEAVVEKPEMLGYYAAVDENDGSQKKVNSTLQTTATATTTTTTDTPSNNTPLENTSATGQMPYSDVIEEMSYLKSKHIIIMSQNNIHSKIIKPVNKKQREIRNGRHGVAIASTVVVQYSKNFPPYISWARLTEGIVVIGKEAEKYKTRSDTFNVTALLRDKVHELQRTNSFMRISTEEIIGKFLELMYRKMTSKGAGADVEEHVIVCSGSLGSAQRRCLVLASVIAGFGQTKFFPFNVAQTTAIMRSLSVSSVHNHVLVLHYTWSVFEAAVVTWSGSSSGTSGSREAIVSSVVTSEDQPFEMEFLELHKNLMTRVLLEKAIVPNESTNPALTYYRNIIARALSSTQSSFDQITTIYVILQENCGAMRNILWRNLDKKTMMVIEENRLMFEPEYMDHLYNSSGSTKRCYGASYPLVLIEDRLMGTMHVNQSSLKRIKTKSIFCYGRLTFHRNGSYQVCAHVSKQSGNFERTIKDENGTVSQLSLPFKILHSQNGLFNLTIRKLDD